MFNAEQVVHTVPITEMNFATGTWANGESNGILYKTKTAASEASTVTVPINPDRRYDIAGLKISSIKLPLRVATSSLTTTATFTLFRVNDNAAIMSGTGDVVSTEITTTSDAASLTGADANDRAVTITVSDPAFDYSVDPSLTYSLKATISCDASVSLRIYPAKVILETIT